MREAGFAHHTFIVAPFYYQNLTGPLLGPQKLDDGSLGWALPIDPKAPGIAMGDINELGGIVAGAFANPERAGHGEYLPLVGDMLSFGGIVETINRQGHAYSFRRIPRDAYASLFPGAAEMADTLGWFEAHTYLGSDWTDRIALASETAGKTPTPFAAWARTHLLPRNSKGVSHEHPHRSCRDDARVPRKALAAYGINAVNLGVATRAG